MTTMHVRQILVAISLLPTATAFAQTSSAQWALFTNTTRNIDWSHPRADLGLEFSQGTRHYAASIGVYYLNPYDGMPAKGVSAEVSCQFPFDEEYDLCIGASIGEIRYQLNSSEYSVPLGNMSGQGTVSRGRNKRLFDLYATFCKRYARGGHFWYQPFLGAGIRYRSVVYGEVLDASNFSTGLGLSGDSRRDRVSQGFVPSVRFGLLIGFRIGH